MFAKIECLAILALVAYCFMSNCFLSCLLATHYIIARESESA